jgi:UDP-N-acetylglucosamine--N-acetylmuramyl-(pentapeptide) pyrophosphoryl-undecaprenol N-acetylglucosamine transferase
MNKSQVWFFGGGSGGHIFPLITLFQKMNSLEHEYIFWTDHLPLSIVIVIEAQKKYPHLLHKILRYNKPGSGKNYVLFILFSFIYFFKFCWLILRNSPCDIYLSGGYIGLPASFAIYLCNFFLSQKINLHLYHLDVVPGKAARLISYFNPYQYIIYDETKEFLYKKKYIEKILYPVRYNVEDIISTQEAKEILNIQKEKKVILIVGGSQGSEELNSLVKNLLSIFLSCNCFIIHQTGKSNATAVKKFYDKFHLESFVFDFREDMNTLFSAADIVISRAGAGTIAEIIFFKKKAILVPLKNVANNHQELNAIAAKHNNSHIEVFSTVEELKISLFSKLSLL